MIKETLLQLGLTEKEIEVYLVLLKHGQMTPVGISRLTTINRTTVYTVLKELSKKGLTLEDKGQAIQTFVAQSPETLQHMVKKEEMLLQRKKEKAMLAVEQLSSLASKGEFTIPRITFIEEDQMYQHSYSRTDTWNKSVKATGTDWVGYFDHTLNTFWEEYIEWYWKQESSKETHFRLLTNEKNFDDYRIKIEGPDNREIQFWDEVGELSFSTMVMGNYILLLQTREKPFYMIEIFDAAYAKSQRQIFTTMWKLSSQKRK